jgi:MFS family permease
MSRSLVALKNVSFRTFVIGEVVSTVGSWMQMLAQSWLVLTLTDSGTALGVTLALQTLPMLVIGAWAGVVADRVDCRRILQITAVCGAVQAIGLGAITATGHVTVAWIYVFAFVLGINGAFERPALHAMIYELAGPDELSSAIGIASTINSSGRLLGPAIAGLLIATVGTAPVFFLNAFTFAAILVALALIPNSARHPRATGSLDVKLRDGLRHVWHDPTLRVAMAVMGVVGLFAFNFAIIVPTMIRFEFHASAGALGIVQMVGGVGSIAGGLAAGMLYRPSTRVLGLVAAAFGACIFLSSLAPSVAAFALLWLPLGVASAMFTTVDQTVLQQSADPAFQGRVMSLFTIAWMGTTPIGGLIAGTIIDTWSARAALVVGATATVGAGLLALAVSQRRTLRRGDAVVTTSPGLLAAPELEADLAAGT